MMKSLSYDREEVKAAMPLERLCAVWGVVLEAAGPDALRGLCPVHEERSPSFTVHPEAGFFKCFGCGAAGDVFELYALKSGLDCKDKGDWPRVLEGLAVLGGVGPRGTVGATRAAAPAAAAAPTVVSARARGLKERPVLPPMRRMLEREMVALGKVRHGISMEALVRASDDGRLFYSEYPLDAEGRPCSWTVPSWFITDSERWCGQWRSLSGRQYYDRAGWKCCSTKNVGWVVGCADIGDRECVLLTEGGADLLAAYHLLSLAGLHEAVAVCCLFGASARMAAECLPFFAGKRVRIMMDEDAPREQRFASRPPIMVRPGTEWAWHCQCALQETAAQVETVSLAPLAGLAPAGEEMKDLNDVVRWCGASPEVVDLRHLLVW